MSWVKDVHKCEVPSEEEVREHEPKSIWVCPLCDSRWEKPISKVDGDSNSLVRSGLWRIDYKPLTDTQGWNSGAAGSTVTGRLHYNEPAFEEIPPEGTPVDFTKLDDPNYRDKWNLAHEGGVMYVIGEEPKPAKLMWCDVDKCPAHICGGPHYNVETDMGIESVRVGHMPIGTPLTVEVKDERTD